MSRAPKSGDPDRPPVRPRPTIAAALPYAVFLLLTVLSWNRWLEPYVDGGRELETPWRVSGGEALYRDVRFYHGPFAPYLAAAVDRAAGPSIPVRTALAGAIALAGLEGLRRLARRLLTPGRAALATSLVVAVCFFQRPGGCHLFPFSLDTSAAAAAIVWSLVAASGRQSASGDRGAAICLLVALLSRPEMGLAAIAALGLERRSLRRLWIPAGAPLATAAAIYAALSAGTPLPTLRGEGWLAILGPPQAFRNIYAAYAGLERPALRLAELALSIVVLTLVASILAGASAMAARARGAARGVVLAAALAILALAGAATLAPPAGMAETLSLFPPLVRVVPPVLIAAALVRLVRRLWPGSTPAETAAVPDAVLYVAALFAARLLLAAGYVGPYSAFLLPLPLLLAVAGLFRLADRAARPLGSSLPFLLTGALVLFGCVRAAELAKVFRHAGWSRVRTAAGAVWLTEPVASATRDALQDLSARVPTGGSLVGFPEAGFFNYVLKLRNPLPQDQFFPGHLDAAAEADAIARLARRPPDAVLYANVLAVGHRSARFGNDYLADLDRTVRTLFESAAAYGPGAGPDPHVGDPQFFVEIRVPRSTPAAPAPP